MARYIQTDDSCINILSLLTSKLNDCAFELVELISTQKSPHDVALNVVPVSRQIAEEALIEAVNEISSNTLDEPVEPSVGEKDDAGTNEEIIADDSITLVQFLSICETHHHNPILVAALRQFERAFLPYTNEFTSSQDESNHDQGTNLLDI